MGRRPHKMLELTPHELSRAKGGFVSGDFRIQADLNKIVYPGIVKPSIAGATLYYPRTSKDRSQP
jgi:hypothetical protein